MKLKAVYSSSTFYPIATGRTTQAEGRKQNSGDSGYGSMKFLPGSPFGNSDWVKQKAEPKNRDKKK